MATRQLIGALLGAFLVGAASAADYTIGRGATEVTDLQFALYDTANPENRLTGITQATSGLKVRCSDSLNVTTYTGAEIDAISPMDAVVQDDGGAFTDLTTEANDGLDDGDVLYPNPAASGDALLFGNSGEFASIDITITTAKSADSVTITFQYWNGSSYVSLSNVNDPSNDFEATGTARVTWDVPSDWAQNTVNSQGPYNYVRAEISGDSTQLPEIGIVEIPVGNYHAPAAGEVRFAEVEDEDGNATGVYNLLLENSWFATTNESFRCTLDDQDGASTFFAHEFGVFVNVASQQNITDWVEDGFQQADGATAAGVTSAHGATDGLIGTPGDFGGGGTLADNLGDLEARTPSAAAIGNLDAYFDGSDVAVAENIAIGTCDSGTVATCVDAARTEADDDYWNGVAIRFTSGNLAGQMRCVYDFTASSDTIAFRGDTTQAVSTHTYRLIEAPGCIGVIAP